MHNSYKRKIIDWRNCANYDEWAYLMPDNISSHSLYTMNKYRGVLDIKWEKFRYNITTGYYERTPYISVDYSSFYPRALYITVQYFSTLIQPQRKTSQYLDAISFQLETEWYKGLYSKRTAYGILKLMVKLNMIYRYDNRKGYNCYYLNPVVYHDLSLRQMELYRKNTAHLFSHKYNELPRNKGDCDIFVTPGEQELVLI